MALSGSATLDGKEKVNSSILLRGSAGHRPFPVIREGPCSCHEGHFEGHSWVSLPASAVVPLAERRPSAAPDRAILLLPVSRLRGRSVAAFQGGLVGDQDLVEDRDG